MSDLKERREKLKSSVKLHKLIGKHITMGLGRGRDHYKGLCPFHPNKGESGDLCVVPSRGFYHCFCCGAHGDAVEWLITVRAMTEEQAIEYLEAEWSA
jgi:DNA primase